MQRLSGGFYFYCPRCGTLRREFSEVESAEVPKIVERCRAFAAGLAGADLANWIGFGVAESINKPGERPR